MKESARLEKILKKVVEVENRPDLSDFAKQHLAHIVHGAMPDLRHESERDLAVHRMLSENGLPSSDRPVIFCYPPEVLTSHERDEVWKEIKRLRGW